MFSSFFGNYISHLITISHRSHPGTDESMPARYSDGLGLRHIAKAEFTQDEDRQLYVIDSIKTKNMYNGRKRYRFYEILL